MSRLRRGFLKQLEQEITEAVGEVALRHGLDVKVNTPRHNKGVISFAIKLLAESETAHEMQLYQEHAEAHGMQTSWLGKHLTLPMTETVFMLAGWNQTNKKLKVVLLDPEGERHLETPETIINFAVFQEKVAGIAETGT